MSRNDDDKNEGETTSLLASSSAPPDDSRPRPTLADRPYNPTTRDRHPVQPTVAVHASQPSSAAARRTLTNTALEELERGARRLVDDDIDSDSVNGLLAGLMEYSDDETASVRFGSEVGDNNDDATTTAAAPRVVTSRELEFLARRAGVELLEAHDDPHLEQRILSKSLKLDDEKRDDGGGMARAVVVRDDDRPLDPARVGGGDSSAAAGTTMMLSRRMNQSTRNIRASVGGARMMQAAAGDGGEGPPRPPSHPEIEPGREGSTVPIEKRHRPQALYLQYRVISMVALTIFVMLVLGAVLTLGTLAVGPPRQPVGPYRILEAQVGDDFWKYYDFYAGKDSAGSGGYIEYVSEDVARRDGIVEVVTEVVPEERMIEVYEDGDGRWEEEDWMAEDLAFLDWQKRKDAEEKEDAEEEDGDKKATTTKQKASDEKKTRFLYNSTIATDDRPAPKLEPFNPDNYRANEPTRSDPTETFVRISSSPTPQGPRNSVRLEGRRRFNRGLFIIDLRHMPAGCGTWPAFWLTDEANWPVNGEIDIVEGVNYQDTAKTALHTTRECRMDDVAEGSKTGSWDTAVGIPNRKTGIPDMTFRFAQNCFVYDPHQWINQGCVATDLKSEGRSLGMPLNAQGGGVYALEWDPVNGHIRTWVFTPHGRVPGNLREALRTATDADLDARVAPDTNLWGLPYGHFPIGEDTNCPSGHFRNMRLVINLAFCGSVSGNRYFMDCPEKFKKFKTCNEYVKSDPEELKEAYWKIRGVYVYEREWERQWT